MPNREIKEERRKIGPADPATRNRLLAEALAGGGGRPAPKSAPVRGSSSGSAPGLVRKSDTDAGMKKLLNPKSNIEDRLKEMGE